jgi:ankyrin repeat protein
MSDAVPALSAEAASALERLRKRAKRLLRQARAADPAALQRLRAQLPRLAALDDGALPAEVKLADAHHALARELGLPSWAELKRQLAKLEPVHVQARRFLSLLPEHPQAARAVLDEHPAIAGQNVYTICACGEAARLAELLASQPGLASAPEPGTDWTPLLYLCASPLHGRSPEAAAASVRCAELLLGCGADPNRGTLWDPGDPQSVLPPLYYACIRDNPGLVELLLQRGANPNDGESTYHSVQENRFECAELLLKYGADFSGEHQRWTNTPLYFMSGYFEGSAATPHYLAGIRWLLEHGANPDVPSYATRETPLHRCATFNHGPELAGLLLAHGALVDAPRADGRTPYVLAVRTGNLRLAEYLLEHGADPGKLAPIDELIGCAMAGDAAGARRVAAAHPGLTATVTPDDLRSVGNAAWLGRNSALRVLAELGFRLDAEGEAGGTPLHAAAWHGNAEAVAILLDLGAPVNVRDSTYGSSPLAWAAHGSTNCKSHPDEDYVATARLLLDAGADRETSINKWGEPPENMASVGVAALLRERGVGGGTA